MKLEVIQDILNMIRDNTPDEWDDFNQGQLSMLDLVEKQIEAQAERDRKKVSAKIVEIRKVTDMLDVLRGRIPRDYPNDSDPYYVGYIDALDQVESEIEAMEKEKEAGEKE